MTSKPQKTIQENSTSINPEEDFYEYAMSDIPESVLTQETLKNEEPTRKNEKLVSLRDVLIERGNFWQDNQIPKVENIWERDFNMPEEELAINDTMVVGDVLPVERTETKKDDVIEKEPINMPTLKE